MPEDTRQVLGLALFAGRLILAGMFSLESFVLFGSFSKDTNGENLLHGIRSKLNALSLSARLTSSNLHCIEKANRKPLH